MCTGATRGKTNYLFFTCLSIRNQILQRNQLDSFLYHNHMTRAAVLAAVSQSSTIFILDRCNRYQLCIHLVYLIKWKQSDDFYLYLTMSPMYKDNLCRSKLIKVRLFDEVFFRFFVQRWYLCEALITHPDATGTKMLDLSHTLISHQLLYPTNILSFFPVNADYDCVSASSN